MAKKISNNFMQSVYDAVMNSGTIGVQAEVDEIRGGLLSREIDFNSGNTLDTIFVAHDEREGERAGALNRSLRSFNENLMQGILSARSAAGLDNGESSEALTDAQVMAGYFGQFGCLSSKSSLYSEGNLSLNGTIDPSKVFGVGDSLGGELQLSELEAGNLAFSVEDNINASQFTTVINIALARQEDMIERFFPTVVIDPKESGVKAIVKYTSFTNEWTRDIDDNRPVREKIDRKSIIKNLYNTEILGEDRTRVVPVYRTKFDTLLDKDFKYTEKITGEAILSAPYKFGEKIDIIRVGQTDSELEKGKADYTDSLLPTITLSDVFLKFTIDSQVMKFKFDVSSQPGSNFGYIGNGHFKGLQLNFEERPITINFGSDTTQQFGGEAIPSQVKTKIEQVLTSSGVQGGSWKDYRFTFLLTISGTTNIETGEVTLFANKIVLSHITDSSNQELDLTKGLGKALSEAVTGMEIAAYNLTAYRSNTNLRTKGRMIRIDQSESYLVAPWRGPFQVTGPITRHTGNECDYDHVSTLITAVTAASDIHGMLTLERYADSLRLKAKNPINVSHEFDYDFNNQLVNTYYADKVMNLTDHVDSIMSHQRMVDTQAAIMNELRLSCLNMLIDSNYLLAYNVLYRQSGQKPTILIGTDPIIKEFLLYGNEGSNVIPGVNFDIVVDSTLNPRIKGKMFVTLTLGKKIGELNGLQALNFGYRLYSIAVTATINPETSNNRSLMRTMIIPRYKHEALLPIMMVYQVTGLPEVIKKLPVLTK